MKQHITKEQWEELSNDEVGTFLTTINAAALFNSTLALPSIGQMIEFLGEDWYDILFRGATISGQQGLVDVVNYLVVQNYRGELCDALWEAVKHKLTPHE